MATAPRVNLLGSTTARPNASEHLRGRADGSSARAGAAFALAATGIVLGVLSGEATYPRRYTTFDNTISDLSGTEPPHSVMLEPSRTIFIVTMLGAGALVLVGTWFLHRAHERRRLLVAMACFGVGLIGVAVFPGNVAGWHPLFALICFLGGAVAAILSRRSLEGPFRYFAMGLGMIALVATGFGLEGLEHWWPQDALGRGGVERWIAYPVLLWLMGFGAQLMCRSRRGEERSVS
jgi:hypothetical membrane protein